MPVMGPICCRFIPISDLMLCYDFSFDFNLEDSLKYTPEKMWTYKKEEEEDNDNGREANLSGQVIGDTKSGTVKQWCR